MVAFTAVAGVTCSAGSLLTAPAAGAAAPAVARVPAAPALAVDPPAASGWGIQQMGGAPNPAAPPATRAAPAPASSSTAAPRTVAGGVVGPGQGGVPAAAPVLPTLPGGAVAPPSVYAPTTATSAPARPAPATTSHQDVQPSEPVRVPALPVPGTTTPSRPVTPPSVTPPTTPTVAAPTPTGPAVTVSPSAPAAPPLVVGTVTPAAPSPRTPAPAVPPVTPAAPSSAAAVPPVGVTVNVTISGPWGVLTQTGSGPNVTVTVPASPGAPTVPAPGPGSSPAAPPQVAPPQVAPPQTTAAPSAGPGASPSRSRRPGRRTASPLPSTSGPWTPSSSPSASPSPGVERPGPGPSGTAGSAAPVRGWTSGASGNGVADGSFAAWRGSAVTVAGTWDDGDASVQRDLPTLKDFSGWTGDLDVAVGGTVLDSGESYAQAAQGAYVDRWTAMAQNLQAARGTSPGTTYVRPFHEFNGDWYKGWFVTPQNVQDYQKAFRLMAQTIRAACPQCKIVWSPNNGSSSGAAPIAEAYPGDEWVDVIGVDSYNANGNVIVTNDQTWTEYANATDGTNPVGPEAWRQFAQQHGKPISFPEWGLNHGSGGGDNPAYVQHMHDWMAEHAAAPGDGDVAGKVVYDVYFNVAPDGNTGFLIKDGPNPLSAQAYTSVRWGNTDGAAPAPAGAAPASPQPSPQPGQQPSPQPSPQAGPQVQPPAPTDVRLGPVGVTGDAQTLANVPYATTSASQRLDLHLPRRTGTAVPVVLVIHGGAFSGGGKDDTDVQAAVRALVDHGYAAAAVEYRLSGEAPFPAGLQDVKAATRWLRAHAGTYGLDPGRFAAWARRPGGTSRRCSASPAGRRTPSSTTPRWAAPACAAPSRPWSACTGPATSAPWTTSWARPAATPPPGPTARRARPSRSGWGHRWPRPRTPTRPTRSSGSPRHLPAPCRRSCSGTAAPTARSPSGSPSSCPTPSSGPGRRCSCRWSTGQVTEGPRSTTACSRRPSTS